MATRAPGDRQAYGRLTPPSGNGVVRERVAGIQRARLTAAMSEVACEHGAANVTTALVVARAGVSRRTFYEIFTDCNECFLAALDDAIVRVTSRVVLAYETAGSWRERIRPGLIAFLGFLDQEPVTARVLIVESLAGGPEAIAHRSRILNGILPAIDAGRSEKSANPQVTTITAEGVLGGAFAVIHKRMLENTGEPFIKLAGPLMAMIVLPYLGSSAANQELARPLPSPKAPELSVRGNPLGELPMRLTYRTVRVLQFIASNPQSTNSQIGRATEIADQGQISKLLARLQRLGLTQNNGPTPGGKGKRNAWALTEAGLELEHAMSVNTTGPDSQ